MGLGSWITDTFTTSANEAKRNEYRKLKNYLSDKKPDISRRLQSARDKLDESNGVEQSQGKGLLGDPFETFDEKTSFAVAQINSILQYMEDMLGTLQSRINRAAELERYYQRKCDEEDRNN